LTRQETFFLNRQRYLSKLDLSNTPLLARLKLGQEAFFLMRMSEDAVLFHLPYLASYSEFCSARIFKQCEIPDYFSVLKFEIPDYFSVLKCEIPDYFSDLKCEIPEYFSVLISEIPEYFPIPYSETEMTGILG
jgi:hypothetical protein